MKEEPRPAAFAGCLVLAVFAASLQAQSTLETRKFIVQGRCVDAATGKPIARCEVKLAGHKSTGSPLHWGIYDWRDPVPVTTGKDGRFRFEAYLPSGSSGAQPRYHLDISHTRYASWFSQCSFPVVIDLDRKIDYGDIALPVGSRPRVRVVDKDGEPQPGVAVLLVRDMERGEAFPDWGLEPQFAVSMSEHLRTDIDGQLHFDGPLEAGTWTVTVKERKPTHTLPQLVLPRTELFEIVVDSIPAADAITGKVVDTKGIPVGSFSLAVFDKDQNSYFRVDRSGRFLLRRPAGHDGDEAVIRRPKNRRHDGWVEVARLEWGQRDAKITMPAKTRVRFEVSLRDPEAPLEDFNLYCVPVAESGHGEPLRLSGRFDDGRAYGKSS